MEEIRWRDYEYTYHPKTVDWFWGLGLISIVIAGISIYFGNLLFGLLVLIGAVSVGLFAIREPKEIDYVLSEKSVNIGETVYRYLDLESFFVDEQRDNNKLILLMKKFFVPYIVITIKNHSADEVRDFMLKKLLEAEHHEPLIHALADRLGI